MGAAHTGLCHSQETLSLGTANSIRVAGKHGHLSLQRKIRLIILEGKKILSWEEGDFIILECFLGFLSLGRHFF